MLMLPTHTPLLIKHLDEQPIFRDNAKGYIYLVLLHAGFTEPQQLPAVLVGSYPTVSPLPPILERWRYTFCCTFRRLTLSIGLTAFPLGSALLFGVRTFLTAYLRCDCLLSLSNNNILILDEIY